MWFKRFELKWKRGGGDAGRYRISSLTLSGLTSCNGYRTPDTGRDPLVSHAQINHFGGSIKNFLGFFYIWKRAHKLVDGVCNCVDIIINRARRRRSQYKEKRMRIYINATHTLTQTDRKLLISFLLFRRGGGGPPTERDLYIQSSSPQLFYDFPRWFFSFSFSRVYILFGRVMLMTLWVKKVSFWI